MVEFEKQFKEDKIKHVESSNFDSSISTSINNSGSTHEINKIKLTNSMISEAFEDNINKISNQVEKNKILLKVQKNENKEVNKSSISSLLVEKNNNIIYKKKESINFDLFKKDEEQEDLENLILEKNNLNSINTENKHISFNNQTENIKLKSINIDNNYNSSLIILNPNQKVISSNNKMINLNNSHLSSNKNKNLLKKSDLISNLSNHNINLDNSISNISQSDMIINLNSQIHNIKINNSQNFILNDSSNLEKNNINKYKLEKNDKNLEDIPTPKDSNKNIISIDEQQEVYTLANVEKKSNLESEKFKNIENILPHTEVGEKNNLFDHVLNQVQKKNMDKKIKKQKNKKLENLYNDDSFTLLNSKNKNDEENIKNKKESENIILTEDIISLIENEKKTYDKNTKLKEDIFLYDGSIIEKQTKIDEYLKEDNLQGLTYKNEKISHIKKKSLDSFNLFDNSQEEDFNNQIKYMDKEEKKNNLIVIKNSNDNKILEKNSEKNFSKKKIPDILEKEITLEEYHNRSNNEILRSKKGKKSILIF